MNPAIYLYVDTSESCHICQFVNIQRSLQEASQIKEQSKRDEVKSGRLQLRKMAVDLHAADDLAYTQTFENWSAVHKFGNTTSMYLQRILYFIQVQTVVTPPDTYEHLFAPDIIAKINNCNVERIDAKAIVEVIHGLRVYHNGVKDLLNFRTQCLDGLSISARKNLSLAQIAQLYVSIFQHDSIWEYCWKSVIPVMNHTILSSRDRFFAASRVSCWPYRD